MEESKRQKILDAAVAAFSKLGFKKASIAEIAKAAGVAKGTVYLACENKEDLFYQVVMKDLRKWIAAEARFIDPRRPADETLLELAKISLGFFDRFPLVRDLLIGIYHGDHPSWAERFEALRVLGRANVSSILRLGISQGRFRQDLDVEQTAAILQDFQHAAMVLHKNLSLQELQTRLENGFALLYQGLRPATPTSSEV